MLLRPLESVAKHAQSSRQRKTSVIFSSQDWCDGFRTAIFFAIQFLSRGPSDFMEVYEICQSRCFTNHVQEQQTPQEVSDAEALAMLEDIHLLAAGVLLALKLNMRSAYSFATDSAGASALVVEGSPVLDYLVVFCASSNEASIFSEIAPPCNQIASPCTRSCTDCHECLMS